MAGITDSTRRKAIAILVNFFMAYPLLKNVWACFSGRPLVTCCTYVIGPLRSAREKRQIQMPRHITPYLTQPSCHCTLRDGSNLDLNPIVLAYRCDVAGPHHTIPSPYGDPLVDGGRVRAIYAAAATRSYDNEKAMTFDGGQLGVGQRRQVLALRSG